MNGNRKNLDVIFDGGWSDSLTLTTTNPLSAEVYQETFDQASRLLTSAFIPTPKQNWILSKLVYGCAVGDRDHRGQCANAKGSFRRSIMGNGVTFGLSIKGAPKVQLIMALSVVLGGFSGAAVVLVRNVIRNRNEQRADM